MSNHPTTAELVQIVTDREAKASAHALLANGWDPFGDAYDLGTYIGDLQQLEDVLGRTATRDERTELERMIRDYLVTLPRPQSMASPR